MKRKEILEAAIRTITQGRQNDYGEPEDNFATIAKFWTIYTGAYITPKDVAAMMILLKVARTFADSTIKDDTWIDIAGYAACGAEVENEKAAAAI